jgi:hypothetical protein
MESTEECYLHFETTAAVVLRDLFNTLTPILVDGNLVFNEKGLHIRQFTKTMFIGVEIFADKTEKYVFRSPPDTKELVLGVNFGTLCHCFRGVSANDVVSFRVTHKSYMNNTLVITFKSEDCTQYELRLLALEYEANTMPPFVIDTVVTLPSEKFQSVIQKADKQADYMQIMADVKDSCVFFAADGDDCGFKACFVFTPIENDNALRTTYTIRDSTAEDRSKYSIRHLMAIAKATNMSDDVRLLLPHKDDGDVTPLIIMYKIGLLGHATFCVACHIDEAYSTLESIKAELAGRPIQHAIIAATGTTNDNNTRKKARRQSIANASRRLEEIPTSNMPWVAEKRHGTKRKKVSAREHVDGDVSDVDGGGVSEAHPSEVEDNDGDEEKVEDEIDYQA